jgi:DNA modification methylase
VELTLKKSEIPAHLLKYFRQKTTTTNYKPGDLVNIPHLVAEALRTDGWILRQDIIWQKPSPMPESCKNRCTKAHEYVFLLAKRSGYYMDMDAIKERAIEGTDLGLLRSRIDEPSGMVSGSLTPTVRKPLADGVDSREGNPSGKSNKRSVWSIDDHAGLRDWLAANAPELLEQYLRESSNKGDVWRVSSFGYPGAHFATYPPKLIEPMIKAGTSEKGCCAKCGTPWRRVTEEKQLKRERPNDYVKRTGEEGTGNSCANTVAGVEVRTVGWEPGCECFGKQVKRKVVVPAETEAEKAARHDGKAFSPERFTSGNMYNNSAMTETGWMSGALGSKGGEQTVVVYESDLPLAEHPVIPCTVLDPFLGSGTTSEVCLRLGRRSVGIDLSEQYLLKNAIPRICGVLYSIPKLVHLVPHKVRKPMVLGRKVNATEGTEIGDGSGG